MLLQIETPLAMHWRTELSTITHQPGD